MHTISVEQSTFLSEKARAVLKKLRNLDLGAIAYKLMHPDEGYAWSEEQTVKAVARYKIFLLLNYIYPEAGFAPTKEIDQVWHHHILDTIKYARDCQFLFGYFLHHFPYSKVEGNTKKQQLKSYLTELEKLLQQSLDFPLANSRNSQRSDCDLIASSELSQISGCNIFIAPEVNQSSDCIVGFKPQNQNSGCEIVADNNLFSLSGCTVPQSWENERPSFSLESDPLKVLALN